MKAKRLPILYFDETVSIHEFIEYWSGLYDATNNPKYLKYINNTQFDEADIVALFEWKNGSVLSEKKSNALQKNIIAKLKIINAFKTERSISIDVFNTQFANVSAVWRIFLLHIIKPIEFPIYDQHVHRAYQYITNNKIESITKDKDKLDFYFNSYVSFVKEIEVPDLKKIDEAFFAFGKLLNTKGYKEILKDIHHKSIQNDT